MTDIDTYSLNPIGVVHSPFTEKFGIPRQAGLVAAACGYIELIEPFNVAECVCGLDSVSHIWVSFIFDAVPEGAWRSTVRPPRLGGNTRVGVFASRSPYRPNRLGLSVLTLERIETDGGVRLVVSGLDMLDGTPVVDIKPYIPYCDSISDADGGFAQAHPGSPFTVSFFDGVQVTDEQRQLIVEVLSQDIRPAYHDDEARLYGVSLAGFNIKWSVKDSQVMVESVE